MITREEQKIENTWDLTLIYETEKELKKDLNICINLTENLLENKKNLIENKENFKRTLEELLLIQRLIEKTTVYGSHKLDENLMNDDAQKLNSEIEKISLDINKKLAFINSLFIEFEKEIKTFLVDKTFEPYKPFLLDFFRYKKHTLSNSEEKIMSAATIMASLPYKVYSTLIDSDINYENIKIDSGTFELTSGNYNAHITSNNRELRKQAFEKLHKPYKKFNNTLSKLYIGNIEQSIFQSQIRNYNDNLTRSLYRDSIEVEVYSMLIKTVSQNISINHKYLKMRKNIMNLDKLHLYDVYVPLVSDMDKTIKFSKSKKLNYNALNCLGESYKLILDEIFNKRWIDIYENKGKRSGAYSGGTYMTPAYILLNYDNKINDMFTLIHEIGHSVHTTFSNQNNTFQDSTYKIFVAEVASTVNELLLTYYLLDNTTTPAEKLYYLNYLLEQFRSTVIRQTMFAEFELITHQKVENAGGLTAKELNNIYMDLNHKYFGDDTVIDEAIQYEWGRIPHFYYDFYVYQYATSFCAALEISKKLYDEEKGYQQKYLNFLKIGNSKTPIDSLKALDIDLTKPEVIQKAMEEYERTLEKFKEVLENEI